MLVFILKGIISLFFAYIAIDAYLKARKHMKDSVNPRFNKAVSESLAKREYRRLVIFIAVTLASLSTFFFKTMIE